MIPAGYSCISHSDSRHGQSVKKGFSGLEAARWDAINRAHFRLRIVPNGGQSDNISVENNTSILRGSHFNL